MTLNTSQSRGIGTDHFIVPDSSSKPLDPSEGNLDYSIVVPAADQQPGGTPSPTSSRCSCPVPLLLMPSLLQQKCLVLPLFARTSAKWIRFSNTLSGTSTSAVTMLLVAPLPNQRLDLDFHFEERTSATAHRSFRLRRMPRFTPRSALSIRQRIVAHSSSTSPSS
jgi:hypothetical protein